MCAVFSMVILCSCLMSCFHIVLFRYFMNDFEITGIIFVFPFHINCIYIVWSVYFKVFRLLPLSPTYLLTLQCTLSYKFLFYYKAL